MNKKICSLYASNAHLITMLNSYINKEKEEIFTIFEKDLRVSAQKLYDQCSNINWNKTNLNEIIKNKEVNSKKVIVVGSIAFIKKVNEILKIIAKDAIIIDCYYIFEKNIKIKEIVEEYSFILTTIGIEKISKNLMYN